MAVLAIDWSGRVDGQRRHIWIGEAIDGELVTLEAGRTRDEVAQHLLHRAEHDDELVVGFDFSFSLPAWFLDERGYENAPDLWDAAERTRRRVVADLRPAVLGSPGPPTP